jgi:hypothetical protein
MAWKRAASDVGGNCSGLMKDDELAILKKNLFNRMSSRFMDSRQRRIATASHPNVVICSLFVAAITEYRGYLSSLAVLRSR